MRPAEERRPLPAAARGGGWGRRAGARAPAGCPGRHPASRLIVPAIRRRPGACHWRIHTCRFIDMGEAAGLMRLLGDETRLRLLRLLSTEPLNVSELTAILGVAQSGVSRHLGLLRDA